MFPLFSQCVFSIITPRLELRAWMDERLIDGSAGAWLYIRVAEAQGRVHSIVEPLSHHER